MLASPRRHGLAVTMAALITAAALYFSTHARAQSAEPPAAQPKPANQIPEVVVETTAPTKPKAVPAKPKKVAKTAPAPSPEPDVAPVAAPVAEPAPPPATALGTYNPALDLPADFKFPEGTTLTTAGPVYGYRALSAVSATKTATPIEELPQSMQVIPKSLIQDQQNVTVTEALQNVSNVQGTNARSIADIQLYPITLRGFGAEQWLDGLPVVYNAGDRDALAHVERIEVLKGPNAILYGGGAGAPIGGAVNVVSKLPTDKASAEAGITIGSHNFAQPYFDINQPISPNVLFRLTGEYTATDSFIDVLEQDRYSINPTVTFTDRTSTTLTVQGRFSKSEQQTYQGLPAFGTVAGDFRVDRDLFIGDENIERSFSEVQGVTVSWDQKFNPILSASLKARYTQAEAEQNTQTLASGDPTGATPLIPPSTWALANVELTQEQQEFIINPNLIARFNAGPTRNTFLFGGDYSRIEDQGKFVGDYLGNACAALLGTTTFLGLPLCAINGATTVDLQNPVFNTPYADPTGQYFDTISPAAAPPALGGFGPIAQVLTFSDAQSTYTTKGLYAQAQSSLFDTVHLLGGVRLASLEIDYFNKALTNQQRFLTDETKLLPRAGAVIDIFNGLSVYGSYSEGMKGVPYSGRFPEPKPEFSNQYDVGFKFNLGGQLSGTLSYFEINRENVPSSTGLGAAALTNQKSTGYEADVIWQPTLNWQVIASYGHTEAVFVDEFRSYQLPANNLATISVMTEKGNRIAGIPEDSGRLWVNYAFDAPLLKGWSIGAGIYAATGAFIDDANLYKTGGYYTVDAKVAYATESLKASFNVKNLTDNEYFVPYSFLGGQVAPGDERSYLASLALKY